MPGKTLPGAIGVPHWLSSREKINRYQMYVSDAIGGNEIEEGPVECQVTGIETLNRKAREGLFTR